MPEANQTQAPKGENPVISALSVLQAFVLAQKEKNAANAPALMKAFQALVEALQGKAVAKAPAQPATPRAVGINQAAGTVPAGTPVPRR